MGGGVGGDDRLLSLVAYLKKKTRCQLRHADAEEVLVVADLLLFCLY